MAGKIPTRTSKTHNAKPYDRPKSLFQKVASTLCDMFMPSWMLYDSSQKNSSNQNKSEQEAENQLSQNVLQSDINQPLPETSYIPERRPCCSSYAADLKVRREKAKDYDFSLGHRNENEENISSAKSDLISASYVFQRKSSVQHAVVNGDDHSENSEGSASTSGCSSLVSSHQERRDQIHDSGLQINEEGLERISKRLTEKQLFKRQVEKRDISVETDSVSHEIEGSFSKSHQPLWFEDKSLNPNKKARPQPSATGRRPSFSISSFGAPSLSDPRNSANKSFSPFYEGKTVFGGASSNRRAQLLSSVPYQYTRPQHMKLKVKEPTSKNDFDYMSTTAKRILRSLEKMSTPLEDAKKIPAEGKNSLELAYTARHRMMPSILALKRQSIRPSERGPPTSSVLLPSPTVIGKNLEPRIAASTEKKRTDNVSTESMSSNTFSLPTSSASAGGKLKTHIHSSMHHSRKQDPNEVMEIPDLPNVPLPVVQLPTFSFAANLPKAPSKPTSTAVNIGSHSVQPVQPVFTFSSPVEHDVLSSSQIPCLTEASFTFSSPVNKDKTTESTMSTSLTPNVKYSTKNEYQSTKSTPELIIGGSVMDVLGKTEPKELTAIRETRTKCDDTFKEEIKIEQEKVDKKQDSKIISGFGDKFKPEVGSWECTSCLVRNKESDDQCVSCTSPKPNLNSSKTVVSQTSGFKGFTTQFSKDFAKWDTPTAPSENESIITTSEVPKLKSDIASQGFGDKFKPPADSWNCPVCMVNNNNSQQQCISCESSKPQSTKPSSVLQTSTASFGNKFKLPPGSWNCDTCFVPNSSDATKCIACETSRAAAPQIKDPKQAFSGFKFSIPEKQSTNTTAVKFGIPATSTVNVSGATTGFKFGVTTAESKLPESFNFVTSASNQNKTSSICLFGNKPIEKTSEPVSTSAKVQIGFSAPANSTSLSTISFGEKPLSFPSSEKSGFKFEFKPSNLELKNNCEETTSASNSVSLSSAVTSLASVSTPLSSIKSSASLTTVTTTVSVFNFGKSSPIMSTTSSEIVSPRSAEGSTLTVLPKAGSIGFSFGSTTTKSDSSITEGTPKRTIEDTKISLFGTGKPVVGVKPEIGQSVKSEVEQKPNIVQSTPNVCTTTSSAQFSFGSSTKSNSNFVFGTPKTEPSQGNGSNFTFSFAAGKSPLDKPVPASGFTSFGSSNVPQTTAISNFTFGSGALASGTTTTTTATTSSSNIFSFGNYTPQPTASVKSDTTPQTTSASLFGANPQSPLPSFGSTLLSTPTFGQPSQLKQEGFVFQQPSHSLRFGSTTSTPVFRFGASQEQKPAGFAFGSSQEQEQKTTEITTSKPAFNFGFNSPQGEQLSAVPQEQLEASNLLFLGSSQGSEQEKPKSGFNFSFNPPQQPAVFGTALPTTTIAGTVPTFNFPGNAPTAAAFSFSASPANTPSSPAPSSRRIKRAVRRSGLGSGRRD